MNKRIRPTFLEGKANLEETLASTYQPGWFAYVADHSSNYRTWIACRDGWQSVPFEHIRSNGMYMSIHPKRELDIAEFLHNVEYKLKVRSYTKFKLTNCENVLFLQLSPFWLRDLMRMSLLTILLRCALNYRVEKQNHEEALYSITYAIDTKLAIQRFMRGFTFYNKERDANRPTYYPYSESPVLGWSNTFFNVPIKQIRRLLQKKPQSQKSRLKSH